MQKFNLFMIRHLNPNYENMTNISDTDAHLAYQKLFEAKNIFKSCDSSLDYLNTITDNNFDCIENHHTLYWYDYFNEKKSNPCFLGDPKYNPIIYIDYDTKKGLINLAKRRINLDLFELKMIPKGQSNYSEEDIPMLKEDLQDYQNLIKLINYYYKKKMLIAIIF